MTRPEALKGFTMYKSTSNRPFVTVTKKLLTFSKLAINDLDRAPYVHVFFDEENRRFAIQACDKDIDAIPFVREGKTERQTVARWGDRAIIGPIVAMLDQTLLSEGGVRVIGETFPQDKLIIFDAADVAPVSRSK